MSKYEPSESTEIGEGLCEYLHDKSDTWLYGYFCDTPYPLPDEAVMRLFNISAQRLAIIKKEYKKQLDEQVGATIAKDRAAANMAGVAMEASATPSHNTTRERED